MIIPAAWHVLGASVQGTSHLEKNIPCQDSHAYQLTAGGALLLAIADGAGSAERSHEGAQVVVEQVVSSLEAALQTGMPNTESDWQALIAQAFNNAHQSVVQLANNDDAPLSSFATTLSCAVVSDDWLAVGQIGDVAIVVADRDGGLSLTVPPQRGEYANESYFLTMPDGLNYLAIHAAQRFVRSVVLTTDGLLRLAFKLPEYEPSTQFFQPLLTFAASIDSPEKAQIELAAFLNSERVNARTDDDKTLVLATRATTTFAQQDPHTTDEEWG